MTGLIESRFDWSPDQRRLLGGWFDILDDIRALCKALTALPDRCACGDGAAHLRGSCICCDAPHEGRVPNCADCGALLAELRPRFVTLTVDTIRFFPVVTILRDAGEPGPARPEADPVEYQIAALMRRFDRLVVEAGEFESGCRASHLTVLKETANALLRESRALNEQLEKNHGDM